ncbi:hypothetical protein GCM10009737_37450 [Nocardioides lentus]|uniref:MmcQ/YjbR family DNA-binding protein n=1 Tax=Nocardioides lentus TaxID=338077 RepID=A0ABP5B8L8_9ACTN
MDLDGLDALATGLDGVRRTTRDGLARWQYDGRLVVREVDARTIVVRVPFDVRALLLAAHPAVFAVPQRYARHMMVVAYLDAPDPATDDAVEDAVVAAWRLQRAQGRGESGLT